MLSVGIMLIFCYYSSGINVQTQNGHRMDKEWTKNGHRMVTESTQNGHRMVTEMTWKINRKPTKTIPHPPSKRPSVTPNIG